MQYIEYKTKLFQIERRHFHVRSSCRRIRNF